MKLALLSILIFVVSGVLGYALRGSAGAPSGDHDELPTKSIRELPEQPLPDGVEARLAPIRGARDRDARLLAVIDLAVRLPDEEFEQWSSEIRLPFLDEHLRRLFRALIAERWMEADPAGFGRWSLERGVPLTVRCFERWLELDESGAIEWVQGLPGDYRDFCASGLVQALGKKNQLKALALLRGFTEDGSISTPMMFPLFMELAEKDHEAMFGYLSNSSRGMNPRGLMAVMGVWVKKDFAGAVEMLEREGIGWRGLEQVFIPGAGGFDAEFLPNLRSLPEGWLESLIASDSSVVVGGYELDWLQQREVEGLSAAQLQRIQEKAVKGDHGRNGLERQEAAELVELVEHGSWLPTELRAKLAAQVISNWEGDWDTARAWAETLDEELRSAVGTNLDKRVISITRSKLGKRLADPSQVVSALVESEERVTTGYWSRKWGDRDVAVAVAEARKLPVDDACAVVEYHGVIGGLPVEVASAFADRVLLGELPKEEEARTHVRDWFANVGRRLALENPVEAGEWALRLPAGELRASAVEAVAAEWVKYSEADLRAWAERLEPEERGRIGKWLDE